MRHGIALDGVGPGVEELEPAPDLEHAGDEGEERLAQATGPQVGRGTEPTAHVDQATDGSSIEAGPLAVSRLDQVVHVAELVARRRSRGVGGEVLDHPTGGEDGGGDGSSRRAGDRCRIVCGETVQLQRQQGAGVVREAGSSAGAEHQ